MTKVYIHKGYVLCNTFCPNCKLIVLILGNYYGCKQLAVIVAMQIINQCSD